MSGLIELVAADGHRLSGYEIKPSGACLGVLVVLREIFGANKHIRLVCEKIRRAQSENVTIHVNHASHGFNCNERVNYLAPSVALASQRTLEFLQQSLTLL